MIDENNRAKQQLNIIEKLIYKILDEHKVLQGNWHLGEVTQIISSTKIKAKIDGGEVAQTISCNPDVTFSVGNHIWVIFINGNGRDKFALCKRAIEKRRWID